MPHLFAENSSLSTMPFALEQFADEINELAQYLKLNLAEFEIDHLCLRVANETDGKNWLTTFLHYGRIISQNTVNGRPIYLIALTKPLNFLQHSVSIIELPMPKKESTRTTGWEHIEIVMPFQTITNGFQESIAQWQQRILQTYGWESDENLAIKCSQPSVTGEQRANPTIALRFRNGNNRSCIKIHPYSIQSIIED